MKIMNDNIRDKIADINKIIHSPARLSIVMYLYIVESADAVYLLNNTNLTWGNLSTHLSKLEDVRYVTIEKKFVDKKPKTMITLTKKGREAFDTYRSSMENVLSQISN